MNHQSKGVERVQTGIPWARLKPTPPPSSLFRPGWLQGLRECTEPHAKHLITTVEEWGTWDDEEIEEMIFVIKDTILSAEDVDEPVDDDPRKLRVKSSDEAVANGEPLEVERVMEEDDGDDEGEGGLSISPKAKPAPTRKEPAKKTSAQPAAGSKKRRREGEKEGNATATGKGLGDGPEVGLDSDVEGSVRKSRRLRVATPPQDDGDVEMGQPEGQS
jgi:hypothetical protein